MHTLHPENETTKQKNIDMGDKNINGLFEETKGKLNGFAMLYYYHLCNLCIKADPMALLSATIEVDDSELNLEDVADAAMPDEYTFAITPRSAEYILPICKAIKLEHPEFKMQEKQEQNPLTDEQETIIHYTMPEVDDNRREVCMDYIQAKYEFVTAKMEVAYKAGSAKIFAKMAGAPAESIEKVREELEKLYNQHKDMCDKFRDDKTKEVEEGYQRYLNAQSEQDKQKAETQAAEGKNSVFSMNMNEEE